MNGSDRPKVLVIGIGNPDRGDDGVGRAVVRRLMRRVPHGVSLLDRSGDALALLDDWAGASVVILVDAVAPISEPGRVHRLNLTESTFPVAFAPPSTHALGIAEAVELARSLGRLPRSIAAYVVEGEQFETGAQLSPVLVAAVDEVAEQILTEISGMLKGWKSCA